MKKFLSFFGLILLIPSLLLNIYLLINSKQNTSGILVLEVLDGDTILLDGDVRFRLRNVDAPELQNCGGKEARNELTVLVKNKRVIIKEQILDTWGRPMGLIYADNISVNQKILESGWVRYHHDNTTISKTLSEIGLKVKKEQKGIFSTMCRQTENKEQPKCNIKGNIDPQGGVKRYYYPGCVQYQFAIVEKDLGEKWFCTTAEAEKNGYVRAATCK